GWHGASTRGRCRRKSRLTSHGSGTGSCQSARGRRHMNPRPAALVEAEKKTVERFERREAQKTTRGSTYIAHAEGMAVCETLLPYLVEFMRSEDAPTPPKGDLSFTIRERELTPEELALVALSSLLNGIAVGRKKKDNSPAMTLKLAMGRALHDKLL